MTTDAQKRAHAAHMRKLKESGWVRCSVWLSPKAQKRLVAIQKAQKLSRQKALELILSGK